MDTGNEPLPTDETASILRNTGAIAPVAPSRPASRIQWITHVLEDIRPTPGSDVTRIYGLSDCVIAVAFTLFVVNIHLPPSGLSESQLQSAIAHDIILELPFYLVSYLVVASSWISHYPIVTYLKRSNNLFVLLNVVFLASIVFLPVPLAFFYQYGNQAGVWQVFASTQVITSTTLLLLWVVARIDHLLDPEISPEYLRAITVRLLVIPLGTLVSLGASFLNVWLAEGILLLFYVLGWILHRMYDRHHPGAVYLQGTTRMCSITLQYDRGGDYLPDYHRNGHPRVRHEPAFFAGAERGPG